MEDDLSQLLFSLGLPHRVDQIIKLTKQIRVDFQGMIPDSYTEFHTYSGIGDYIASAVCCFGFGHSIIIVDTNTVRIVAGIYAIKTHAESRRKRDIREKHRFLLDIANPRAYNFALLDLDALTFTPKERLCSSCPIINCCEYIK